MKIIIACIKNSTHILILFSQLLIRVIVLKFSYYFKSEKYLIKYPDFSFSLCKNEMILHV